MDSSAVWMIVGFPLGYGVVLIGLAYLAQPLRRDLVDRVEVLLRDKSLSANDRRFLNRLLDTSISFRVGIYFTMEAFVSIVACLLCRVKKPDQHDNSRLESDRRYHEIAGRYLLSVFAANPIFASFSIPLILVGAAIRRIMGESIYRAVEEPIDKASHAVLAV